MARQKGSIPGPCRRVRITWSEGKWRVVKEVRVANKVAPRSLDFPEASQRRGVIGFWFEATDAEGRAVYRRFIEDPTCSSVELFAADGTISREQGRREQGSFSILIPDLPEITELRFFRAREQAAKCTKDGALDSAKGGPEPVAVLKIRQEGREEDHGSR